jgi:phosphoglycolate phosphatase
MKLNKEMKKSILFDFDGVIADTFDFCYVLHQQYYPGVSVDDYRKKMEGNIYEALKPTAEFETVAKLDESFFAQYGPELMKRAVIESMGDVIINLAAEYNLFIVSSSATDIVKNFLTKEKLSSYFKEVLGYEIEHRKVKKIKMIQDKYHIESSDALFITDTLGDIREAEKCGIKSIAVSWGYHPTETLEIGNPVAIADTPEELVAAIRTNLN